MGILKESLSKLAKMYQDEIQRRIIQEDLVDKGGLRDSITHNVTNDGFSISSDKNYAYLLGANGYLKRFNRPPAQKPAEWARSKGIRPLFRDSKGRFKKIDRHSYRRLGFALAKSIDEKGTVKRYGYRGSRIIPQVNQLLEGKLSGEITEAYKLELVQGMKQTFKFENIKIE